MQTLPIAISPPNSYLVGPCVFQPVMIPAEQVSWPLSCRVVVSKIFRYPLLLVGGFFSRLFLILVAKTSFQVYYEPGCQREKTAF